MRWDFGFSVFVARGKMGMGSAGCGFGFRGVAVLPVSKTFSQVFRQIASDRGESPEAVSDPDTAPCSGECSAQTGQTIQEGVPDPDCHQDQYEQNFHDSDLHKMSCIQATTKSRPVHPRPRSRPIRSRCKPVERRSPARASDCTSKFSPTHGTITHHGLPPSTVP